MSKHLHQIDISGFKSINHLSLKMRDVNILIGANGAGKSNFISLFTFLGNLSRGKLKKYIETEGGAERFFHFGTRNTKLIKFHVKVGNNDYNVVLEPNVDRDSLVFSEEYCKFDDSPKTFLVESRNGESGLAYVTGKYGVQQYTKAYLEDCRVYHFHDTSNSAQFKKTQMLDSDHYLETDAANIAPFLYRLKTSESKEWQNSYSQIVAAIKSIAPFFHDFYLEPTGENGNKTIRLRWTHSHYENPFSANILSDGTSRFICMAVLFLQPEALRPSTIILDEPELGLHPAALVTLSDIIKQTSRKTQIICSTQSVTFANQFDLDDFIVVDAKEGVSEFKRPNKEDFKLWLDEFGVGDIWSKNLIGGRPQW